MAVAGITSTGDTRVVTGIAIMQDGLSLWDVFLKYQGKSAGMRASKVMLVVAAFPHMYGKGRHRTLISSILQSPSSEDRRIAALVLAWLVIRGATLVPCPSIKACRD